MCTYISLKAARTDMFYILYCGIRLWRCQEVSPEAGIRWQQQIQQQQPFGNSSNNCIEGAMGDDETRDPGRAQPL